tara:strand:+ start:3807 stop:4466 length:660 start_codon:yes stop_codon:yes gene_type:complete
MTNLSDKFEFDMFCRDYFFNNNIEFTHINDNADDDEQSSSVVYIKLHNCLVKYIEDNIENIKNIVHKYGVIDGIKRIYNKLGHNIIIWNMPTIDIYKTIAYIILREDELSDIKRLLNYWIENIDEINSNNNKQIDNNININNNQNNNINNNTNDTQNNDINQDNNNINQDNNNTNQDNNINYSKFKFNELIKKCKELGIKGYHNKNKATLIDILNKNSN